MSLINFFGAILVVVGSFSVFGQDVFVLEGERITDWGAWGELELCPPLTYVYGMRLKVQGDEGFFGDDTALNGIELLCVSPGAKRPVKGETEEFATITSTVGAHGNYKLLWECPAPSFAIGYQLRSEEDQGGLDDDTAANNLRLICSTGEIIEGDGEGWGDWTRELRCPRSLQLCGIQTQVEGANADESSLNNVNMACCD